MAICESKANTPNKTGETKGNIQNDQIKKNHLNNMQGIRKEDTIDDFTNSFKELNPDASKELSKEIFSIKVETKRGRKIGNGFILSFPIDLEWFNCLLTNDHIINNESINNNNIVNISDANIKLDKNKRYIKNFKDQRLDITVVEILNEDNISKEYYLEPELDIPLNNKLINNEIYIPQNITEEKKLKNVEGIIKNINRYEFSYSANTNKGSSGNPIFLKKTNKVIGIQKTGTIENIGDFIYPVINTIKEDIRKKRNNSKYINGKYIYDDGKYYIGEVKNNLPNGKGIKYYKNGNIMYEGNFNNGKFNGNGKIILESGKYYIGQFKNGLPNGKGTLYYSNGNIMYEGDVVNNKPEGNGKFICEDGEYYIGQFKNELPNGKGTLYYSNGKIKYEGDFINDKPDGNGKYILENGKYYIGEFKNGLKNGKGTYYHSNGNLIYEGDFVNDKYEGNGKGIWDNGNYYIGQWKNDLRNGKGTLYLPNGNIKYIGDFVNDKFEGNGKGIWENGKYYIGQWKNDLRNGKGVMYYSDGKIKKKGIWINDKFVGNYENIKY